VKNAGLFPCALLSAGIALASCSGGTSAPPVAQVASTATTVSTQQVAGSPIAHVIVLVMENRTPDNLFCQGNPAENNTPFPGMNLKCLTTTTTSLASPVDPEHTYPGLVKEWDNGNLDGFATDPVDIIGGAQGASLPGFTYTVAPANEVALYSTLAATYASSDTMFSSGLVPTFPGHQYLFAGQSAASDDPASTYWGCNAPAGSTVTSFGAGNTVGPLVNECADYQTIADLMNAKGVSWRYYTGAPNTVDGNTDAVEYVNHLYTSPQFNTNVVTPPDAIDGAIQNCQLPSVSFVTPPAFASDHSGTLSAGGPGFVGDIYLNLIQTLQQSQPACQYLNNTAIILTWDDSGGWYDHVPPPIDAQTGRPYGFRVPLIVISNYANHPSTVPIFVSHNNYFTFGSILKYIEDNWNLGTLGTQDSEATDLNTGNVMTSLFNYAQKPIAPIAVDTVRGYVTTAQSTERTPAGTPVDDDK
jgi:phospholipase C